MKEDKVMTETQISKELFETEAQITQKLLDKIARDNLQGITVRDGHFQPVEDFLMSQGTWRLEFHLNVHKGMRLLRALVKADETTGNKLIKYHENYVRINYPEEYKKYKEGK